MIEAGSLAGLSNLTSSDLGSAAAALTATGVGAGTYYVRVRAKNACGISGPSNEVLLLVAAPNPTRTCGGLQVPSLVTCVNNQPPQTPTAVCNDSVYSCSQNRSGTCSTHGGVRCYVCPGPLC